MQVKNSMDVPTIQNADIQKILSNIFEKILDMYCL